MPRAVRHCKAWESAFHVLCTICTLSDLNVYLGIVTVRPHSASKSRDSAMLNYEIPGVCMCLVLSALASSTRIGSQ